MQPLNLNDVGQYVAQNIGVFHQKRIQSLDKLKLVDVLRRKNPYLFKAKHLLTANDIVKSLVDAHSKVGTKVDIGAVEVQVVPPRYTIYLPLIQKNN
ncbi:MAG: hypothetical protein KAX40_07535 [Herpetosiphon sp.]|nr:hypothetical protein [Herpetosiphon sp.]